MIMNGMLGHISNGTMIHMLAERRYPLSRELMIRMLDHGMEVEDESEIAIALIHLFILWTTEDAVGVDGGVRWRWCCGEEVAVGGRGDDDGDRSTVVQRIPATNISMEEDEIPKSQTLGTWLGGRLSCVGRLGGGRMNKGEYGVAVIGMEIVWLGLRGYRGWGCDWWRWGVVAGLGWGSGGQGTEGRSRVGEWQECRVGDVGGLSVWLGCRRVREERGLVRCGGSLSNGARGIRGAVGSLGVAPGVDGRDLGVEVRGWVCGLRVVRVGREVAWGRGRSSVSLPGVGWYAKGGGNASAGWGGGVGLCAGWGAEPSGRIPGVVWMESAECLGRTGGGCRASAWGIPGLLGVGRVGGDIARAIVAQGFGVDVGMDGVVPSVKGECGQLRGGVALSWEDGAQRFHWSARWGSLGESGVGWASDEIGPGWGGDEATFRAVIWVEVAFVRRCVTVILGEAGLRVVSGVMIVGAWIGSVAVLWGLCGGLEEGCIVGVEIRGGETGVTVVGRGDEGGIRTGISKGREPGDCRGGLGEGESRSLLQGSSKAVGGLVRGWNGEWLWNGPLSGGVRGGEGVLGPLSACRLRLVVGSDFCLVSDAGEWLCRWVFSGFPVVEVCVFVRMWGSGGGVGVCTQYIGVLCPHWCPIVVWGEGGWLYWCLVACWYWLKLSWLVMRLRGWGYGLDGGWGVAVRRHGWVDAGGGRGRWGGGKLEGGRGRGDVREEVAGGAGGAALGGAGSVVVSGRGHWVGGLVPV
ncbi:hypothetical protein Tco_0343693 [Tanacetum coccineum]